jgi:hypothetical protein
MVRDHLDICCVCRAIRCQGGANLLMF